MDDMLCYSQSLEQHVKDVCEVLSILQQEGLDVKASKCEFGRCELGFLRHRGDVAGVAFDQRKVSAVRDWPVPISNAELRICVWLCNYYIALSMSMPTSLPLSRACAAHSHRGSGARRSS
jgi:hypothetical protein